MPRSQSSPGQNGRGRRTAADPASHGRGTGVPHPIDVHVGRRIRLRRLFLRINQESLARPLGLTFQQVQKYENGANRVSASRLAAMAEILGVSVSFFFDGLLPDGTVTPQEAEAQERMERPETIELVRLYFAIADERVRRQFLALVKAVAAASP